MGAGKRKNETVLEQLIEFAATLDLQVRTERLLREVGYRAQSGRCRLQKQDLIILDRDAPLRDQIEFLVGELARYELDESRIPDHLTRLLRSAKSRPSRPSPAEGPS